MFLYLPIWLLNTQTRGKRALIAQNTLFIYVNTRQKVKKLQAQKVPTNNLTCYAYGSKVSFSNWAMYTHEPLCWATCSFTPMNLVYLIYAFAFLLNSHRES